jgi:Flp pilus assembly protein TadG
VLRTDNRGTSLLETALVLPILIVMCLYAVDFGYFFLVAGNLVTSSRNAVLYSTQGFSSPAQQQLPSAGTASSLSDTAGVAGIAGGDLSGLANMATNTQVEVCSKSIGVTAVKVGSTTTGYTANCSTYPTGSLSFTPDTDPESKYGLLLQRVDVVYTIAMPVSLNLFGFSLTPPSIFHWQVEMRAID